MVGSTNTNFGFGLKFGFDNIYLVILHTRSIGHKQYTMFRCAVKVEGKFFLHAPFIILWFCYIKFEESKVPSSELVACNCQ